MATEKTEATKKAPDKPAMGLSGGVAAESSNPQVHALLAEYETARLNDDRERMDALRTELRELGYE